MPFRWWSSEEKTGCTVWNIKKRPSSLEDGRLLYQLFLRKKAAA